MIDLLKKANKNLMYALVGVAVTFSRLGTLLMTTGAAGYSANLSSPGALNMSYGTLLAFVLLFSVAFFALLAKLLTYISFRIVGSIFTRKSGMLYPFPIGYGDYVSTVLAFSLPCFLIEGAVSLPALFIPTLTDVLAAVSSLVTWIFLALNALYFVRRNGHDYDRRALAVSLSIIPFVLVGLSLVMNVVGVLR